VTTISMAPEPNGSSAPSVMVVLTIDGLTIYVGRGHLVVPGAAGLMLLQELATHGGPRADTLARIARNAGATEPELSTFIEELRSHALVGSGEPRVSGARLPRREFSHRPLDPDGDLILPTPYAVGLSSDGFECLDHDGRLIETLTPLELEALTHFRDPCTRTSAFASHVAAAGPVALDRSAFDRVVERLHDVGILRPAKEEPERQFAAGRTEREWRHSIANTMRVAAAVDRHVAAHDGSEPSTTRTNVVSVHSLARRRRSRWA
jgi:hypothetical protein